MVLAVKQLRPRSQLKRYENFRLRLETGWKNDQLACLDQLVRFEQRYNVANADELKIVLAKKDNRLDRSLVIASWEEPGTNFSKIVGYSQLGLSKIVENSIELYRLRIKMPNIKMVDKQRKTCELQDVFNGLVLAGEEIWMREFFYLGEPYFQSKFYKGQLPVSVVIKDNNLSEQTKKLFLDLGYENYGRGILEKGLQGRMVAVK